MYNPPGFVRNSAKDAEKPGARKDTQGFIDLYLQFSCIRSKAAYKTSNAFTHMYTRIRIHRRTRSAWIFQQKSIGDSTTTHSVGVREHAILPYAPLLNRDETERENDKERESESERIWKGQKTAWNLEAGRTDGARGIFLGIKIAP
ncbi:hypothetical protein DBV15_10533 [Temnothorax longispinosus]|uniref:Uncharacterized protein n=1 Tax=Temnothorax longispinosus TaxID=300112 RepID=A0A4S2JUQ2_9HYME|nr:hypothetical protein DBV15_10533 [Temnothorax longispinosus]